MLRLIHYLASRRTARRALRLLNDYAGPLSVLD